MSGAGICEPASREAPEAGREGGVLQGFFSVGYNKGVLTGAGMCAAGHSGFFFFVVFGCIGGGVCLFARPCLLALPFASLVDELGCGWVGLSVSSSSLKPHFELES